jgi:hypothetical protein
MALLSRLACRGFPIMAVLSWISYNGRPVAAVLSSVSILAVLVLAIQLAQVYSSVEKSGTTSKIRRKFFLCRGTRKIFR